MSKHPRACVLLIGNEILSGRTQDKNLNYIAKQLLSIGVRIYESRVIPDDETVIINTINECREKYDYVLTTGGIGPTHDDITTACVAKAFSVEIYRDADAEQRLKDRLKDRINASALTMADFPVGAELIKNPVTAAPGFKMDNVFVMAGIPQVMHGMLEYVLPYLTNGSPVFSESVQCDLPESYAATGLSEIQKKYPSLEIGSYPRWPTSEYRLCLIARGSEESDVREAAEDIKALIISLNGKIIEPSADDEKLASLTTASTEAALTGKPSK